MPGLLLGLFLLLGFGGAAALSDKQAPVWGRPDRMAHSSGKTSRKPDVFVRLGQSSQVCARETDKYARIDVFVNLINLPPQKVRFVVDDGAYTNELYGNAVHLTFTRVALGPHTIDVYVDGYRAEPFPIYLSVWECMPIEYGPLYNPDGTMKGL